MQYLLPVRLGPAAAVDELAAYLHELADDVDVLVVDGSDDAAFERLDRALDARIRHVRPDPSLRCANGKAAGVITGLRLADDPLVVVADDDVRYTRPALREVEASLAAADVVRPQNVFTAWPWHAREDTARTLLNRAFGADYPGTLGLRVGDDLRRCGYDGDVLFENLELIRTVRALGGRECVRSDLFVPRHPPTTGHFLHQRVRQAYDSWAQPPRFALELALLPAAVALVGAARRRGCAVALAVLAPVLLAETGRRRHGGRAVFPPGTSLWAPVWVLERGVCAWVALGLGVSGRGVRYGGRRLRTAAHPTRVLRRCCAPA